MNQGFSQIIGEGLRHADAQRAGAFQNLAEGLGSASQGIRQHLWNRDYNKLLQEQERMGSQIMGSDSAQRKAAESELENRMRGHNIMGNVKGLRTSFAAKDYAQMDADKAEMEFKQGEEMKNQLLDGYKNARMTQRIYEGRIADALPMAGTPEGAAQIEEYKRKSAILQKQSGELRKAGLAKGIAAYMFDDDDGGSVTQEDGSGGEQLAESKDAVLAMAMAISGGKKPTMQHLKDAAKEFGINLNSSAQAAVLKEATDAYEAEMANKKAADEEELMRISKQNAAIGLEASRLGLAKQKRVGEEEEQKYSEGKNLLEQQRKFFGNADNARYSPERSRELSLLIRDYKDDQKLKGSNIQSWLTNMAGKLINKDLNQSEYTEAFNFYKNNILGSEQPQQRAAQPSKSAAKRTATEDP